MPYQLYTSSQIHWKLIEKFPVHDEDQSHVSEECCCRQALFCPYYVALEGALGADWGVIVNPESPRFGLLTFEHADCCCGPDSEGHVAHGEGDQTPDQWKVPTCRNIHQLTHCVLAAGHEGLHRDARTGAEWDNDNESGPCSVCGTPKVEREGGWECFSEHK